MNDTETYSPVAKWLHWIVVAAIALQFLLAELGENASASGNTLAQLALLAQHKSVGMTVLALAFVRLLWRRRQPAPPLPDDLPDWQRLAVAVSHGGLYLCLFLLPLSGWLMSSATAYSVSWFNLFTLPDLVAPDEGLTEWLKIVHEVLATLLFGLVVVHVGAALKHALWDKDGVLQRMSSVASICAGLVTLLLGVWLLVPDLENTPATEVLAPVADQVEISPASPTSDLPVWEIDYGASYIEFSGEQAGAPFTGRWTDWRAEIQFDSDRVNASAASVVIQTTAVDSDDAERDKTIRGPDFFASDRFATALFVTETFTALESGEFSALGKLQIKEITLPVQLNFKIAEADGVVRLTGQAKLDRLAFSLGEGDWQDTTWVGQFVTVTVLVEARTPKP